jgi:hypothetical protein
VPRTSAGGRGAACAGLAEADVLVIGVADATIVRAALHVDLAQLARGSDTIA